MFGKQRGGTIVVQHHKLVFVIPFLLFLLIECQAINPSPPVALHQNTDLSALFNSTQSTNVQWQWNWPLLLSLKKINCLLSIFSLFFFWLLLLFLTPHCTTNLELHGNQNSTSHSIAKTQYTPAMKASCIVAQANTHTRTQRRHTHTQPYTVNITSNTDLTRALQIFQVV